MLRNKCATNVKLNMHTGPGWLNELGSWVT